MKRVQSLTAVAKVSVLCLGLILLVSSIALAEYSFKVNNTTGNKITQILVSPDGSEWGQFDIGDGIEAGATVELVWSEAAEGESCEQFFKATFADGSESESTKFNFCEEGLTLEF